MRAKNRRRRRRPIERVGAPPGTLIAMPGSYRPTVRLMAYGADAFEETSIERVEEIRDYVGRFPVVWIDVDGLGDAETIRKIGEIFHLHPLALEDVLHPHQRAKVEPYEQGLFIIARMIMLNDHLATEQLSVFLGRNYVVSFQEQLPGDTLEPVRQRIRGEVGRMRLGGPDHLMYSLLDAVVDACFPVLEHYGEKLEEIEDNVLDRPGRDSIAAMHAVKRDLLTMRRAVWPMREAFNSLIRDPIPLISDETRIYLRDCLDHTHRVIDFIETARELASDLMELYLSSINNRMNEIIKVLTITSTIFIPMTFISSIYGMNFDTDASPWNMPELHWEYGYPLAISMMVSVALGMLSFFIYKGWIGATWFKRRDADSKE